MNRRDYEYIESRLYGDPRLHDAHARLRELGEDYLADRLMEFMKVEADQLRLIRAALEARRIG